MKQMNKDQQQLELLASKFSKKSSLVPRRTGNYCVSYNRVSSKDQMVNGNSLGWQNEQITQYAIRNNLVIKSSFGGTFESAKTDERKEFKKMLEAIKKDKSISSILVYCYDRFSRSGANGIFLLENLRSIGIRIISISQELDSETPTGMFQENLYMLISKLDNDMRKDKSIAGTKSILRKGYWPYSTPLGYLNKNKHVTADKHDYAITSQGLLIQQAFKWKAAGKYSNTEIVSLLKAKGLKISLRHLAWVFSNFFYCGYICSTLLPGELIKGKHPAIIDEETFLRANNISQQNPRSGVPKEYRQEELPLKVFVKDENTLSPFTGYLNKKKNLYYYKARGSGVGVNISAKKLNQRFLAELQKYEYDKKYKHQLKDAIKKSIVEKLKDSFTNMELNRKQISELQHQIDDLEEGYVVFKRITKEQFEKYSAKYIADKRLLEQENEQSLVTSSNLDKAVNKGLEIAENISEIWRSSEYSSKQKLQYLLFPDGIMYNKGNDTVRTPKINSLFASILLLAGNSGENKRGIPKKEYLFGSNVGETGFEPATPWSQTRCATGLRYSPVKNLQFTVGSLQFTVQLPTVNC